MDNIKTWQERTGNHPEAEGEGNIEVAMCAEIADLRAALARAGSAAPAAPTVERIMKLADDYADGSHTEGHFGAIRRELQRAVEALAAPAAAVQPSEQPAFDPVVEANRKLLLERSHVGMKKYATTLAAAGLSRAQLAQHALEEALDLANYLQTIIQADAATPEQSDATKGRANG